MHGHFQKEHVWGIPNFRFVVILRNWLSIFLVTRFCSHFLSLVIIIENEIKTESEFYTCPTRSTDKLPYKFTSKNPLWFWLYFIRSKFQLVFCFLSTIMLPSATLYTRGRFRNIIPKYWRDLSQFSCVSFQEIICSYIILGTIGQQDGIRDPLYRFSLVLSTYFSFVFIGKKPQKFR